MKIRVFLTILLAWTSLATGVFGSDAFREANHLFASGDFAKSAGIYQKIIDTNGASASLYYNLGNSEYRLGHLGPAILAYERARLLSPRDPDLIANLNLARKSAAVFDKGRFNPRIEAIIDWLSLDECSWLVVSAALWIGILSVIFGLVKVGHKGMRRVGIGSIILAGFLVTASGTALVLRYDEGASGIVLTKEASVYLSPFDHAESIGTPGGGRIVQMGARKGGYIYVDVPGTDLHGWMDAKEVKRIVTQ
jgi:tetratricopeptide (TPR) repeat protein